MKHPRAWVFSLSVFVMALGIALPARAQQQGQPWPVGPATPAGPDFGTTSFSVSTVDSYAFVPFDSATTYIGDGSNGRSATGGNSCFEAALYLPSGAVLDHAELESCDSSASSSVSEVLFICHLGACTTTASVNTGTADTPGCGLMSSTPSPVVIDNGNHTYTVQVCAAGATTVFKGVRFYYKLQVSPAPASATFNDVATDHPFFQYIEALAASGITGGCGGGNYCPDAALTRGQMAVFLAKALGLHFPN